MGNNDGTPTKLRKPLEVHAMVVNVSEIFFGFSSCASSQAFVVFDLPAGNIFGLRFPLLVFHHGKELLHLPILGCLDDWSDELLQEALVASEPRLPRDVPATLKAGKVERQVRPEVVKEIDQEALDVRTVVVLVCHDHHLQERQHFISLQIMCMSAAPSRSAGQ